MEHLLVWIIQVDSHMAIRQKAHLVSTYATLHNGSEGAICFLTCNLDKKQLPQDKRLKTKVRNVQINVHHIAFQSSRVKVFF